MRPLLPFIVIALAVPAWADEAAEPTATPVPQEEGESRSTLDKAGHYGTQALGPFMLVSAVGIGLKDDFRGERMSRSAGAILTTGALTEALKRLTQEKRPNGANNKSFPSGHASLAFSTATLVDAYQPGYKGWAYAAATGISLSRVIVKAHYPHDVIAGAALGHFVTRAFTKKYRGEENSVPTNLPAATPGQFLVPNPMNGSDGWHVNMSGGRLAIGTSW